MIRAAWAAGTTALVLAGCADFGVALREFDSVSKREGAAEEPEQVAYADEASRDPWLFRNLVQGTPLADAVTLVFDVTPEVEPVENPPAFARERLLELAATAGGDPVRQAIATNRALWIGALDPSPLNQITALQAYETLLLGIGLDPTEGLPRELDVQRADSQLAEWLAVVQTWFPGRRDDKPFGAAERRRYAETLRAMTERPLLRTREQRNLIRALINAYQLETQDELVAEARSALGRAVAHGLRVGLLISLRSRAPDVREAAVRTYARLRGAAVMPWVLDRIAQPSTRTASPERRYDPNPWVRMTLLRLCGQVRKEAAERGEGQGPSPVEYLYEVAVGDPEPHLRLAALEALAFVLQVPFSDDAKWAEEWWRGYVLARRRPQ